jgi:hypothetical protein
MGTNDDLNAKKKEKFLEKFKEIKTVYTACQSIKLARRTLYNWLKEDHEFKADFDEIRLGIGDDLESKAFQLIDKMVEKGDYGRPVLLITMLNANNSKYKTADNTSDESRQLMEDFRKMAAENKKKPTKPKAVKEAEDIINDSDSK